MARAIAIAVNAACEIFALEDEETGACAVFEHSTGPVPIAGDLVSGDIFARTLCSFVHGKGACTAYARTGPISRRDALLLVDGPSDDADQS
jgi:hypothetical protein